MSTRFHRLPAVAFLLVACSAPSLADDAYSCPIDRIHWPARPTVPKSNDALPLHVYAQTLRADRDGATELEGAAELTRGAERVTGDYLRYDGTTGQVEGKDGVQFSGPEGDRYQTDFLALNLDTHLGEAGAGHYMLRNGLARGDAARIEFLGPDRRRLSDARYTTCREGQDDWFLDIGELDLDTEQDIGTARNTRVEFYGVPIFYFPYVSFPLSDKRKSGFLFARVGYSDTNGIDLAAPYYLNLAPHYDATLTPRILSKRGLLLENEVRYLHPTGRGTLDLNALPNDRLTDDDRAAGRLQDQRHLGSAWSTSVDARWASDRQYLKDFGDGIDTSSQGYLPRTATLSYNQSPWMFSARLEDHQMLDETVSAAAEPYARLPQLLFASTRQPRPNTGFPQLEAEWNRFAHERLLAGDRFNLNLGIGLPLENAWGFVTPKIGARYLRYALDRANNASPSIAAGVFSLDSGVFFERPLRWGEREITQTLEPRLFYLRVPARDQDDFPLFDTALPDFSFASLFRENRFVGGDRIGDANQLTAALTTRFLDGETGIERLRLSAGRIYYFDDLEVNIPPAVQSPAASDIIVEASAWLASNWYVRDTQRWDAQRDQTVRNNFYFQYQPARDRVFSLGHTFQRDQIDQVDVSFEWPLSDRWAARARSLHSLRDERNIDSYAGVEYKACCWAVRAVVSRRWQDPDQVNAFRVEFELAGLSTVGKLPDSPLKQGLFFPYER